MQPCRTSRSRRELTSSATQGQGEGGAAGGQGPTACRLSPGACRCQGEGGPEAEPRRGLAACALRLAPEAGPEGRGRPLPSAVALAGGGWGLGVGADPRMRVVAYWRAGEAASGLGRTGERQGRTVSRNLLLDVGLGQFEKVEKKNFGPNPGPWPGWPGV